MGLSYDWRVVTHIGDLVIVCKDANLEHHETWSRSDIEQMIADGTLRRL